MQARRKGPGLARCTLGTISFPLTLKEVGLQNHVHVGGWGEEGLASRIPLMRSGNEHPYGHFLLCFLAPTLPPCWVWGSTGQARRLRRTPSSAPPPVHLLAGTEHYLCLQTALDSHELFLLPANRSGDGRELWRWRAEKSGPWQKER